MIRVDERRLSQLSYIGLTDKELDFLKAQREKFEAVTDVVVDRLYDNINAKPELARIINVHSTIERLKETQRWYFMTMVEGTIDEAFIEKRLVIGKLHSRIGLTTEWYLGTYMLYLDIAVQCFKQLAPESWMDVHLALSKMFNFDSQLVLEAYEQDEKKKVEKLVDERQSTLNKVNEVVQQLAEMIVELSESSQSMSDASIKTAEIQEEAHGKVEQLRKKVDDIQSVGVLLKDISDQTHLLGLNAAIEAARAGELGLGFGVVADEIRKLATHSKQSLEIIRTTLRDITAVLNEVTSDAERTSGLAQEQVASSSELFSFVNMIRTVTEELEAVQQRE